MSNRVKVLLTVLAGSLILITGWIVGQSADDTVSQAEDLINPGDIYTQYTPVPLWYRWVDILPWVNVTSVTRNIVITNNKDTGKVFNLSYADAPDTKNGHVPYNAINLVSFEPSVYVEAGKSASVPVTIILPQNNEAPDKWQFLIVVKEDGQTGWLQKAYAVRWLVTRN